MTITIKDAYESGDTRVGMEQEEVAEYLKSMGLDPVSFGTEWIEGAANEIEQATRTLTEVGVGELPAILLSSFLAGYLYGRENG